MFSGIFSHGIFRTALKPEFFEIPEQGFYEISR